MIGGMVLAAGAATRFGGMKQLALFEGRPLLEHSVRAMTAAPVGRVVVVLGAAAEDVIAGVDLYGAEPVVCARWDEGQSASLACGLAELADCEGVALGDLERALAETSMAPTTRALKSATRIGMGPCQGSVCGQLVGRLVAARTGLPPNEVELPSTRPPAKPIPLGTLAAAADGEGDRPGAE